jgi:hypothetical protein
VLGNCSPLALNAGIDAFLARETARQRSLSSGADLCQDQRRRRKGRAGR